MLSFAAAAGLGFPLTTMTATTSRPAIRPRLSSAPLMASPLEAVASPLNKWQPAAAEVSGSSLDGMPFEVVALFALIPIVGVLGLIEANGGLGVNAPTLGLGQERDELTEAAAAAEEAARAAGKDPADMTDAEREKEYFKVINAENKKKRGGTSAKRKKVKK